MANSSSKADAFSGRPAYDLYMTVARHSVSGNSTRWTWHLYARQHDAYDSYALDSYPWSVNVEGDTWSGSHNLDFRGSTSSIHLGSGTTGWKAHNADGYLTVNFSAAMGPASIFGSAALSSAFSANRLPKPPDAPPTPTFISATSSVLNFTISAPADNGGSSILDYTLELATDDAFADIVQTRVSGASSQTFIGLDPAVAYRLRYRARNAYGTGPNSGTRTASTLAGAPTPPLNPTIPTSSPTGLTLEWSAPASDGGSAITGYRVTRALNDTFTLGAIQYNQGDVTSREFTDLLPSTKYYFKVVAINAVGTSADSETVSFTTVSGVYVSNGSIWHAAGVFVSDGTTWVPAELLVSNGTDWIAAV